MAQLSVEPASTSATVIEAVPVSVSKVTLTSWQAASGASRSSTMTVKEAVSVLPAPSVASKVIVVVPKGNSSPLMSPVASMRATVAPGQLSETVGSAKAKTAPQAAASLPRVVSAGRPTSMGAWASRTTTSKRRVSVLPAPSVATYSRLVVPTGKKSPLVKPVASVCCVLTPKTCWQLSPAWMV